jgi:type IV pilus assembly protein PilW
MLHHRNDKGFTVIELLVAIVVGIMVIGSAYVTYIAQNRSFATQERVSEVNAQSKIAFDMVANDLKESGFGAPSDMNMDPINGYTSIITPVDNAAGPDAITIVGGFRLYGNLQGGVLFDSDQLQVSSPQVAVHNNDGLSIDGIQFAKIFDDTTSPLTMDRKSGVAADDGRPVYLVEDVTYCVDANRTLWRRRRGANPVACSGSIDPDVIAENVEDLQFAYAVDADGDGQIDDQNGNGVFDAGDFLNYSVAMDPATIRAVRMNILAATATEDPDFQGLGAPPAIIENHPIAPVSDGFRRKWWQTVVSVRRK